MKALGVAILILAAGCGDRWVGGNTACRRVDVAGVDCVVCNGKAETAVSCDWQRAKPKVAADGR